MALAAQGIERSEADVYSCCQTDADGTLASVAAQCAESFGLHASALRLSGLDALRENIETPNTILIIFVNLAPLLGITVIHAVILDAIDTTAKIVHVIDPAHPPNGRREWPLDLFEVGWRLARHQIIMVLPSA
jgi:ABC-type bacteriocin/lantibiotic exporter with double-glycine peptidase domain